MAVPRRMDASWYGRILPSPSLAPVQRPGWFAHIGLCGPRDYTTQPLSCGKSVLRPRIFKLCSRNQASIERFSFVEFKYIPMCPSTKAYTLPPHSPWHTKFRIVRRACGWVSFSLSSSSSFPILPLFCSFFRALGRPAIELQPLLWKFIRIKMTSHTKLKFPKCTQYGPVSFLRHSRLPWEQDCFLTKWSPLNNEHLSDTHTGNAFRAAERDGFHISIKREKRGGRGGRKKGPRLARVVLQEPWTDSNGVYAFLSYRRYS